MDLARDLKENREIKLTALPTKWYHLNALK